MTADVPVSAPWSGGTLVDLVDQHPAVDRLPRSSRLDSFERLAMDFLAVLAAHLHRTTASSDQPG